MKGVEFSWKHLVWKKLNKKHHPTPVTHSVSSLRCFFQDLGPRKVIADFSGGHLSNDGGALLLQQVDAGQGISRTLAASFKDERDSKRLELGAKFSDRYRKI